MASAHDASWSTRLAALDEIIITRTVAWKLLVALLPTMHGYLPQQQSRACAKEVPLTCRKLLTRNYGPIKRQLSSERSFSPVKSIGGWSCPSRSVLRGEGARKRAHSPRDHLSQLECRRSQSALDKLRDEVDRHKRFKDAPWALPELNSSHFSYLKKNMRRGIR